MLICILKTLSLSAHKLFEMWLLFYFCLCAFLYQIMVSWNPFMGPINIFEMKSMFTWKFSQVLSRTLLLKGVGTTSRLFCDVSSAFLEHLTSKIS